MDFLEDLPPWLAALLMLAAAILGALTLHRVLFHVAARVVKRTTWTADDELLRLKAPSRLILPLLAVQLVRPGLGLDERPDAILRQVIALGMIAGVTWLVTRALRLAVDVFLRGYSVEVADNLAARRLHTQFRVMQRLAQTLVIVIGVSVMLMTFPQVRALGTSILASAGIAGIVVGLAAQSTLSNVIAGLQIALTQPVRLDDVVIIDGEWGRIEEITTTYVVVRIWDERRLIVPFSRIIQETFQNWTRTTSQILGTVYLYTDWTVPVAAVRAKVEELVKAHPEWDGRAVGLQVTDSKESVLELRALMSAADASKAWNLRCAVREELVEWLQREHAGCLTRTRVEIERRGVGE